MRVIDQRILIFVPTYNEAENVASLFRQLQDLALGADILFIDDNSPDGTGRIIDELAAASPHVLCIHRAAKLGIGSAHLQAIRWAYDHAYDVLITMDCDFTHSPSAILDFFQSADAYDLVVGSRFLSQNSLPDWNLFRRTLTYGAHIATRLLLGMPLDATGAFRLYRLDRIHSHFFELIASGGYAFFFESLYILWLNGAAVKEIAVTLPARTQGHTKMTVRDALRSCQTLLHLCHRRYFRPSSLKLAPGSSENPVPCSSSLGNSPRRR